MTADHILTGKEYLTRMTSIFSKLFAKLMIRNEIREAFKEVDKF